MGQPYEMNWVLVASKEKHTMIFHNVGPRRLLNVVKHGYRLYPIDVEIDAELNHKKERVKIISYTHSANITTILAEVVTKNLNKVLDENG